MCRIPGKVLSGLSIRLAARLSALLLALGHSFLAAAPNELGHPIVRDFPPGRSKITHLCPAIAQDAAGFIYVAGGTGAYFYDGISWQPVNVPTESAGIRKFATTADGTVYMGGAGIMGYFRGAGASARHISLVARLPPTALGADEIHDVLAVGNTVYFADEEKILIWHSDRFVVVPCPTARALPRRASSSG
jgi:hypothetical protein